MDGVLGKEKTKLKTKNIPPHRREPTGAPKVVPGESDQINRGAGNMRDAEPT